MLPGTWYLMPGTWLLVPGPWYLVPGSWRLVPGTWYLVPDSWYQVAVARYLMPGIWCLEAGTCNGLPGGWNLVPGSRYAPGSWRILPGTWYLVPGTWCRCLVTWYLLPGAWYLGPGVVAQVLFYIIVQYGRLARGDAAKKQRGLSLWGLQDMSESELAVWCFEKGFLEDRRDTLCPKCRVKDLKLHAVQATYMCKDLQKCRYAEACTRREPGLFAEKVSLSKQMQIIYRMIYHNAPGKRECAADADLDPEVVARIQKHVRQIASYWMVRANVLLQVGGEDMDCEADEICFRSKRVEVENDEGESEQKIMWIRFLSVARRGSSLVYFNDLEDRYTAAGQGGGGKIQETEVAHHFLRAWLRDLGHEPRPLLARWSVLHTDGADAYRKLHRETGMLEKYGAFHWWHTWVRHSKKKCKETGVMLPVQFAVRKMIKLKNGRIAWRKGGTQKKDGWFAGVRKHVARRSHATDDRNGIRELVYFYQWCYWRTRDPEADAIRGCHDKAQAPLFDLLSEFGKLRSRLRAQLGDDLLAKPDWLHSSADEELLANLPKPHLGHSRMTSKTPAPALQLGSRQSTKPADWPRGAQSKGVLMVSRKRKQEEQGEEAKKPARGKRKPAEP